MKTLEFEKAKVKAGANKDYAEKRSNLFLALVFLVHQNAQLVHQNYL